jgi:hypothetical protein
LTLAATQQHGLLLIPDISGFTEFVSLVELSHSEHIIADLLELLINENRMDLELCEIEGDALFFYRVGPVPSCEALLDQVRTWVQTFHTHLNLLKRDVYCACGACQSIDKLGLKVIGHWGEFSEYTIKNKTKVIGKDVILVHRLLKNSLEHREYLLVSNDLLDQCGVTDGGYGFESHAESYPVLGAVSLRFLNLEPYIQAVPEAPARDPLPNLPGIIREEVDIAAPMEKVAGYIADLEHMPEWVDGLSYLEYDRSLPLQSGHRHVCVFPDQKMSITLDQVLQERNEFTIVNRFQPPALLRQLLLMIKVERQNNHSRVSETWAYARKSLIGWMYDLTAAKQMRGFTQRSLQNLKAILERP